MSISLDHIEITDQFIELFYWERQSRELKSLLFRTAEFEQWRQSQAPVTWDTYWAQWQPHNQQDPGHEAVIKDLEKFFNTKIEAMVADSKPSSSQPAIKPMTRVGGQPFTKDSKKLG